MNIQKIAERLEGWNILEDIMRKLCIKRNTAYKYLHYLNKKGFVIQKIRKPRGTIYQISSTPKLAKHFGIYSETDLIAPEIEFTKKRIETELKIAYFLREYKKESNRRFYDTAKTMIRGIINWKRLYRYIKAYDVVKDFGKMYIEARTTMKKVPRMPIKYKKLIGV